MKLVAFIILYGLSLFPGKITDPHPSHSAKEVLQKVLSKLDHLKTLRFKQRLELNYASEKYHYKVDVNGYLEFCSEKGSSIGLKYQFENDEMLAIFNGAEGFYCSKEEKSISLDITPNRRDHASFMYFVNSFVMLKNALPMVLANDDIPKSITDTTINNVDYFFVEFTLMKKVIDGMGEFKDIDTNIGIRYQVIVDRQRFLPVQIMKRDPNDDFIRVVYDEINESPAPPAEVSWYYSNYMDRYAIKEPDKTKLIETGKAAPHWKLPVFGGTDSLSSEQFKGKVVLLEFWIAHCGYCIKAVPKLNDLKKKYVKNNFELLALNIQDTDETIEAFITKNKPEYKTLSDSKEVAKEYGVNAFPIVVLIDKKGVILYAGVFDVEKIEPLIRSNL